MIKSSAKQPMVVTYIHKTGECKCKQRNNKGMMKCKYPFHSMHRNQKAHLRVSLYYA